MGESADKRADDSGWTFLTNHSHVLFCLASEPTIRLRDVADAVGITERAVQRIVSELEAAGYITRTRTGRRNQYSIHADKPLRHPVEHHCSVEELLELIVATGGHPKSQAAPGKAAKASKASKKG